MAESDDELTESVNAHNVRRTMLGKDNLPTKFYQAPNPQRMYVGDIVEISANDVERDNEGHICKDTRALIDADDIINAT
jgi:hypothetical protein